MLNIPNAITITRLVLVPVMGYFLAAGAYSIALIVFLVAAFTDLIDGYIARAFGLVSAFGATLDPIADKLSMLVATVLLAWQGLIPLWLAAAIVARDVIIVGGVLAYRLAIGPVKMAPTLLSKANTFVEFATLLLVMAHAAGWIDVGTLFPPVFLFVLATVVASGAQYAWIWGRKAVLARRRAK
jgi:cardiolipin synthase